MNDDTIDIGKELHLLIEQKRGNKELILAYFDRCDGSPQWELYLGDTVEGGYLDADLRTEGKTIEDCITQMRDLLAVENDK